MPEQIPTNIFFATRRCWRSKNNFNLLGSFAQTAETSRLSPISQADKKKTMRAHKVAVSFLTIVALTAANRCLAAPHDGDSSKCSTAYENHNQVDYGPLKVYAVRGTTDIQVGTQTQRGVPGACLVLFTEKDQKLVASVEAGADGHFEVKDVVPGRYRLVARADGLCTTNIPLEVVKSSRRKMKIVVHFRAASTDDCSYGEIQADLVTAPTK